MGKDHALALAMLLLTGDGRLATFYVGNRTAAVWWWCGGGGGVVVVVVLSLHAWILGECSTIHSCIPRLRFFFF